jgi:outer membrane protein TolC
MTPTTFRQNPTPTLSMNQLPPKPTILNSNSLCALCALAAIFLTGCVNQKAEIAKYRNILNADVTGEIPPLEPGERLTMVRALLLANQDNENLMIRGEDFIQAMNDKDRAFSQFLPTISLQPNYTILDNSQASTASGGQAVGTFGGFKPIGKTLRRFEAPAVASGNLFHGFRDVAALQASEWTVEERRQLMLDAQSTLLLDVSQSYYQVLRLEALIDVLKKSLLAQQERVRDAQGKLNAGVGRPLDLAQAEAQVASTRVQMEQARGDLVNARTVLAFLIGAKAVTGPLQDDYAVPAHLATIEDLLFQAWSNREDYKAAKAVVEASIHNVDAAIGEYYPSVTLNVTGYLFRENFTDASKWTALLQVNLPIFSAGLIEADVRTAWSRLRQAALQESLIRRQIEQEVRTRYENLITSTSKLRELDAEIKAAAEAYRQAQAETRAGTGIFLNEITAQTVLLNSELDLANEIFNRKVIDLDLRRATGTLKLRNLQRAATQPTTAPTTMPAMPRQ